MKKKKLSTEAQPIAIEDVVARAVERGFALGVRTARQLGPDAYVEDEEEEDDDEQDDE